MNTAELAGGVRAGDRSALAKAITLVEGRRDDQEARAQELVAALLPDAGGSYRVAVSGPPGVGKSTFVEALGCMLVERGLRVGVLAVDPSSAVSGGSILGDKSRMDRLAQLDGAFIRPSPSAATLGGVTRRTRETIVLLEAARFDVVLVETVGVGQSEYAARDLVDFFVVLALPGAGDELQGIKRGILEVADLVAVNKCDGERRRAAEDSARALRSALATFGAEPGVRVPPVLCVSSLEGAGLAELWDVVRTRLDEERANGALAARREAQSERWLFERVHEELDRSFRSHPDVAARMERVRADVRASKLTPIQGARLLLDAYRAAR
ncbi:MAG: methylmalonyl Co-A mutase-associated GTPase MeaB [Planctomycetota bacterium]